VISHNLGVTPVAIAGVFFYELNIINICAEYFFNSFKIGLLTVACSFDISIFNLHYKNYH